MAETRQQPVQLVERRETDGDLAAGGGAGAAALVSHLDRRGQDVGKLLLETKNVTALVTFYARLRRRAAIASRSPTSDQTFGLAHAQMAGDDLVGIEDLLRAIEYEERALDDVNTSIEQVLDGSAPSPRLVFRMAGPAAPEGRAVAAATAS